MDEQESHSWILTKLPSQHNSSSHLPSTSPAPRLPWLGRGTSSLAAFPQFFSLVLTSRGDRPWKPKNLSFQPTSLSSDKSSVRKLCCYKVTNCALSRNPASFHGITKTNVMRPIQSSDSFKYTTSHNLFSTPSTTQLEKWCGKVVTCSLFKISYTWVQ